MIDRNRCLAVEEKQWLPQLEKEKKRWDYEVGEDATEEQVRRVGAEDMFKDCAFLYCWYVWWLCTGCWQKWHTPLGNIYGILFHVVSIDLVWNVKAACEWYLEKMKGSISSL